MSLDVYLITDNQVEKLGTGVFVREDGHQRELTLREVKERWPNAEVGEQGYHTDEVYSANITHNLTKMAHKAGIYEALWRPKEKNWTHAKDIIKPLEAGLSKLKAKPDYFSKFNAENGWGLYENFVPFVEDYLNACKEYPEAKIEVSR